MSTAEAPQEPQPGAAAVPPVARNALDPESQGDPDAAPGHHQGAAGNDAPAVVRSEFDTDQLLEELRGTRPGFVTRAVVAWPLLAMLLSIAGPAALSGIAMSMGTEVDASLDSFKIQEHPIAEIYDGLRFAVEENEEMWEAHDEQGHGRRRLTAAAADEEDEVEETLPRRTQTKSSWRVHVVYRLREQGQGGSVLSEDSLQRIRGVEDAVKGLPGYSRFCVHLLPSEGPRECRPPNSLVSLLYPSRVFDEELGAERLVFDGNGSNLTASTTYAHLLRKGMFWYTDSDADLSSEAATLLRTDFLFGSPVDGYESATDRPGEQAREYNAFARSLIRLLSESSDDRIQVIYGSDVLTALEVTQVMLSDVMLAGIGLAAVAVFLLVHTRSFFISAAGLLEIIISIPTAYFFFRVPAGIEQTGVLQFLSVFVILGIGIDDVFVFFNAFSATRKFASEASLEVRLAHAYRRAGAAMLVTSFTSAAAFAANIISPIPAVRLFGATIAAMVVVNYIMVMTWFPSCVAFWDKAIMRTDAAAIAEAAGTEGPKPWGPRFSLPVYTTGGSGRSFPLAALGILLPLRGSLDTSMASSTTEGQQPEGAGSPEEDAETRRSAERSTRRRVSRWARFGALLHRLRWPLLISMAALAGAGGFCASRLEGSKTIPIVFPTDHNLQVFIELWNNDFLTKSSCDWCWRSFSGTAADAAAAAAQASDGGGLLSSGLVAPEGLSRLPGFTVNDSGDLVVLSGPEGADSAVPGDTSGGGSDGPGGTDDELPPPSVVVDAPTDSSSSPTSTAAAEAAAAPPPDSTEGSSSPPPPPPLPVLEFPRPQNGTGEDDESPQEPVTETPAPGSSSGFPDWFVPYCPTGVTVAAPLKTSVTLSWTEPSQIRQILAKVDTYNVYVLGENGTSCGSFPLEGLDDLQGLPTRAASVNLTGLLPGQQYSFVVTSSNAVGEASECGMAEPRCAGTLPGDAAAPGAPRGLIPDSGRRLLLQGDANDSSSLLFTTLELRWSEPEAGWDTELRPERYEVQMVPLGALGVEVEELSEEDWSRAAEDGGGLRKATVPPWRTDVVLGDLEPGSTYVWRVRASNALGAGPWSAPTSSQTESPMPPLPPADLVVISSSLTGAELRWGAAEERGTPVTGYRLEAAYVPEEGISALYGSYGSDCAVPEGADASWTEVYSGANMSFAWSFSSVGGDEGGAWAFRVRGLSDEGPGAFSCSSSSGVPSVVSVSASTLQDISSPPLRPELLEAGTSFAVFSVSPGEGHTPATEWRLSLTPLMGRGASQEVTEVLRSSAYLSNAAVGGLSPGTDYALTVAAWNENHGSGPSSDVLFFSTAPSSAAADVSSQSIVLPPAPRGLGTAHEAGVVSALGLWPSELWYDIRGRSATDENGGDGGGLPVVALLLRLDSNSSSNEGSQSGALSTGQQQQDAKEAFAELLDETRAAPENPLALSIATAAKGSSVASARSSEAVASAFSAVVSSLGDEDPPMAALVLDVSNLDTESLGPWLTEVFEAAAWPGLQTAAPVVPAGTREGLGGLMVGWEPVFMPPLSGSRAGRALAGFGRTATEAMRLALAEPELGRAALMISPTNASEDTGAAALVPHHHHPGLGSNGLDIFLYSSSPSDALEAAAGAAGCSRLAGRSPKAADPLVGSCGFYAPEEAALLPDAAWGALAWASGILKLPLLEDLQKEQGPNLSMEVVELVWGISGVTRHNSIAGGGLFSLSAGAPLLEEAAENLMSPAGQRWLLEVCDRLEAAEDLVERVEGCVARELKGWAEYLGRDDWPLPQEDANSMMMRMLEGATRFRNDVGWVGSGEDREVAWVRIRMRSKVSMAAPSWEAARAWEQWEAALRGLALEAPRGLPEARHSSDLWVRMATEQEVVSGLQMAVAIAVGCALLAILVFTGDPWMALLSIVNLAAIIATLLGAFWALGWDIGAIEAISVTVLVGLSCDFCLHLAEAYSHSPLRSRSGRAQESVHRTGSPISAAALTTVMAVLPLLLCTIQVLRKFGVIIAINMTVSLLFGFALFVPLLMVCGPMPAPPHLSEALRPLRPLLVACWGTELRRCSLLALGALGALLCLPGTREGVLGNLHLAVPLAIAFPLLAGLEAIGTAFSPSSSGCCGSRHAVH